jgi:NAD(P)-dependent dehydrogenase (short-subunit alcohol dehydrogenase family)
MQLSGAKAVITGGASGLGLATAERVIEAGGNAVILDINDEHGEAAATKLGARARYVNTDVSNEDSVKAAVRTADEFMGGITLAVNCAGIAPAGRTLGREGPWPSENFNRVIQVNLVGSYNVTKEAAAVMQLNDPNENGERGVVVSTASIAAFEGQIGQAAYSASKGGVVGMMLPLAREFAQFGIRVNTIAPGIFTDTVSTTPRSTRGVCGHGGLHLRQCHGQRRDDPRRWRDPHATEIGYHPLPSHLSEAGAPHREFLSLNLARRPASLASRSARFGVHASLRSTRRSRNSRNGAQHSPIIGTRPSATISVIHKRR